MKIKYKPKQSTNNSTKRIIRDSNPKTVVGTLVGLMATHVSVFVLALVSMFALTFITDSNNVNNTYAVSYEYSIKYNDNVVDNMPKDIYTPEGKAIGGNLTIADETPIRSGYKFLGWCNALPTTTDGTDSCSSTTYQPSAGITIASATNFHLYAMWGELKDISNATYLQEVGSCPATLTAGQVYSLKDSRDEQSYNVAKLADGKCWMVENLNLAGGTALSADDTNVTSAYISSFSTSNYLTKSGNTIVLPASATKNSDNNDLADSFQFGGTTGSYSYVFNSGNKVGCGSSGQNTPCYSYYSWDAATLGSGRVFNNVDNADARQSICPKGWRLPNSRSTVSGNSDFLQLTVAYGMNSSSTAQYTANFYNRAGPGATPNFLLAGYYYGGSFRGGGSSGNYWAATSYKNSGYARCLNFNSGYVSSTDSAYRSEGLSVRCVFAE